jgi:glycosyltransferase involved in cell wall biosynthesis
MKILFLAPQPFYVERGTPIAVRQVVTALCGAGHEVDLVTFPGGEDIEVAGLTHIRIARPPGVKKIPVGFSPAKLLCDLFLGVELVKRLGRRRYDVVHAVEEAVFLALPFRRLARFKLIYDMDSLMSDQLVEKWPGLKRWHRLLFWFESQAARGSDLVLAVCPAIGDRIRPHVPADRVRVTPDAATGLEPASGAVEDLRATVGRDGPLALYVGNLEGYQGVGLLIEAVARMTPPPGFTLAVIGGDARSIEAHQALAEGLGVGDCVRFLGPRPLANLSGYLAQADVLCSPRLKGVNTPMKVYSYMASGVPVLATDILSHTQVLDAGCASLAAPEPDAMAAALGGLLSDPARGRALAQAARARVHAEYSLAAFEARLLDAYAWLGRSSGPRTTRQARRADRAAGVAPRALPTHDASS